MDNINIYNDPILSQKRKGTNEDPFRKIVETLWIDKGYALLTEIPNRFEKVKVSGQSKSFYEIPDGELSENTFKVDYTNGVVFFHESLNKSSLNFSYLGEGVLFFPDSRVYLTGDDEHGNARDKFEEIDTAILEQKNRMDEQIRSHPQPSEVVDMRIDSNGKIYKVAKDRIDAEQDKVEAVRDEVTEARKGLDGTYHNSLKERMDNSETSMNIRLDENTATMNQFMEDTDTKLDDFIEKELTFDYTTTQPVYHTTLNLAIETVNQAIVIDEETGDIYATQVNNRLSNDAPTESFMITRMNANGVLLDTMGCKYGGHGTSIGIERQNGKVYIWSGYNNVDANEQSTGTKLVRFPYQAGITIDGTETTVETYNKFTLEYITPVTDQKNGLIAFRISNSQTNQVVELRNISDVKNGVDNVLGTVNIPSDLHYLQGITIDGNDLYWYNGDTNSQLYPNELSMFSFINGQLKKRITCDFGRNANGEYDDGIREPEGLYLYTNPKSGKKSLFAVVVTGVAGRRINKLYAYHQKENAGVFSNMLNIGRQEHRLTENNGDAKRLPLNITKLSDFRVVGHYYMTTPETNDYTDHPEPNDAGWWLDILPAEPNESNPDGGSVRQRLTRNSIGRSLRVFERVVSADGTVGNWDLIPSLGKSESVPSEITKLSDFRSIGNYYLTMADTGRFNDHPSPNDAGWWLEISTFDLASSVRQRLTRNSTSRTIKVYERVVTSSGVAGTWIEYMTSQENEWENLPLLNGATNEGDYDKLRFAVNGGLLYIQGRVNIPMTDGIKFSSLPVEAAPLTNWYQGCQVAGTTGSRKIIVYSNGDLVASGWISNNDANITYTYVHLVVPLN